MVTRDLNRSLIIATKSRDLTKVKELLDHGAYINAQDEYGFTALMNAVETGHIKTVELLINRGADLNILSKGEYSAIIEAAYNGHADIMELLLKAGADPNIQSDYGRTPLMYSACKAYTEITLLLLNKGADIEKTDSDGNTVMIITCMRPQKNKETVIALIASGACINTVNNKGLTALMYLAAGGYTGLMKLLIKAGADTAIEDNKGRTAFDILKENYPKKYDKWIQSTIVKARKKTLKREDMGNNNWRVPDYAI
ncbi:MAG: hypothetical protein EOM87_09875 [Clostridia bacterium]|nr:hypothetical protein [Clostridia bacterium]